MTDLKLFHYMFTTKKDISNSNNFGNISTDKLKKIEQKQVYSLKYTGQHGDVIRSYWPTLEKAMKAKKELESQGYTVSKIFKK